MIIDPFDPARPTYQSARQPSPLLHALGLRPDRLAIGTAALGGVWGPVNATEAVDTLLVALDNGVAVLDTAPAYAQAETRVAVALREWTGPKPVVSTKIGRLRGETANAAHYDFSDEALRRSLGNSLTLFRLAQLDLVFLHDPEAVAVPDRPRVVESLHRLRADGLVRHIGFGGNPDADWWPFLTDGPFTVAMGFNRLNAVNLDALSEELPVYQQQTMPYYAASPLAMGLLGRQFTEFVQHPPDWVSANDAAIARRIHALAADAGMSLPSLAHRYLFSMAEADRVVIGAGNRADLQTTLANYRAGSLPESLFDRITDTILQTNE